MQFKVGDKVKLIPNAERMGISRETWDELCNEILTVRIIRQLKSNAWCFYDDKTSFLFYVNSAEKINMNGQLEFDF